MKGKRQFLFLVCLTFLLASGRNVFASPSDADVRTAQQSQQKSGQVVSGVVRDAKGEALVGVTVQLVGTSTGVTTDVNGKFSIRAVEGSRLLFSSIGYTSATVAVGKSSTLNVVLQEDTELLDEVVVIGYGQVKKKDATGAVAVIKQDELNKITSVSATDQLMGKVSGLYIVPGDGAPGSGATIRIRNGSSLTATNTPMLVIDGVPVSGDANVGQSNILAAINPNDIESYTVLKDASATAIYGSRASNGVIIITTKKGSGTRGIKVNYSSNYGVDVNTEQVPVLSPAEFRAYMDEFYPVGTPKGDAAHAMMNYTYPDGTVSEDFNTNWQDHIFQPAFATDQNISVAGGGKQFPFRVSLGYTHRTGTLKGSRFQRFTEAVNFSPKFFGEHLKIDLNAKAMQNMNDNVSSGVINTAASFDPTKPVYAYATTANDPNDFVKHEGDGLYNRKYFQWLTPEGGIDKNASQNPVSALLDNSFSHNNAYRVLGNVQVDYSMHFLPELHAVLNLGMDYSWQDGKSGNYPGSYSSLTDSKLPAGQGRHSISKGERKNELLDFYLSYDKEIKSIKSRISATAGYSWQHFYRDDISWTYSNETDEYMSELIEDGIASPKEYYLVSFFGRLNWSVMDRYIVTATLRNDGTSRFSPKNRWGLFPSVALAWRISEENFLKNSGAVDDLKLRMSWGQTGQQDIGTNYYPYIPQYSISKPDSGSNYWFDDELYQLLSPKAYNENIKWETTTTYNVGLDFSFLDSRINGSLEYFHKRTTDLLNSIPVPAGANFTNQMTSNIGSLTSQGVEGNFNFVPVRTKDFYWNIGLNATWINTKIDKLTAIFNPEYIGVPTGGISTGQGNNAQIHSEGYAPNTFYLFEQVYDEDGYPIQNAFVDQDGNGLIDDKDLVRRHSPRPDVYFGLNMSFRYKSFDCGFNSHGSIGNYVFNDYNSARCSSDYTFSNPASVRNVPKAVYYKYRFKDSITVQQAKSDLFLENASFWKLDNITLGYTFSRLFRTDISARISFTAQNVATITRYSGPDPEISSGIANNAWPRPRSFIFGLTINY
ncbi:MAG: SusC/RagA family TonB-linked outer membrane protein [Candidatus Cryptobacteroides sp.]